MKRMILWMWFVAAAVLSFAFGTVMTSHVQASPSETAVDISAKLKAKNSEFLVTNSAGGSTLTSFVNRKAIELQNLGPNNIFCTFDGQAPLATGALGRRIDANGGTYSIDAGAAISVKCIAATAAQVTTAATQVVELR